MRAGPSIVSINAEAVPNRHLSTLHVGAGPTTAPTSVTVRGTLTRTGSSRILSRGERSQIRDGAPGGLYATQKVPMIDVVRVCKESGPGVTDLGRERGWTPVITVTRLDGAELVVNAELIALVEATPDTHLTLTDGRRLIVKEPPSEVVARVIAYRRAAYGPLSAIKIAS